jgi:hypothetical protein
VLVTCCLLLNMPACLHVLLRAHLLHQKVVVLILPRHSTHAVLDLVKEAPLPYQQLTRLQLPGGRYLVPDIRIMISELPQLEVLEVLETDEAFELLAFDAAVLSKLPKLRLVKLSGSLLGDEQSTHMPVNGDARWEDLPLPLFRKLTALQQVNPNIEWALGASWRQ